MRRFPHLVLAAALCGILSACGEAPEPEWSNDFPEVRRSAERQRIPVLALFTGSDWCEPCRRLEETVLSSAEFKEAVRGRAVFFLADFPRRAPQTGALAAQNAQLREKYGVKVFPTLLLLRSDGGVAAEHAGGFASVAEFAAWFMAGTD